MKEQDKSKARGSSPTASEGLESGSDILDMSLPRIAFAELCRLSWRRIDRNSDQSGVRYKNSWLITKRNLTTCIARRNERRASWMKSWASAASWKTLPESRGMQHARGRKRLPTARGNCAPKLKLSGTTPNFARTRGAPQTKQSAMPKTPAKQFERRPRTRERSFATKPAPPGKKRKRFSTKRPAIKALRPG